MKSTTLTLAFAALLALAPRAQAQIPSIDWSSLSNREVSPEGKAALSFDAADWKHAETEHFIYHFVNENQADTVYRNSEQTYGWIKELFGVSEDAWTRKVHVFVFHDEGTWKKFIARAGAGRHAEAFTTGWELFIYRNPFWLAPQKTLAHELTHIIAFRFLNGPIPLFVNEGFAEFMAYRAVARNADGDEFGVRTLKLLTEEEWIALPELTAATQYPQDRIDAFYRESEFLVRFLILRYAPERFYGFLRSLSDGASFDRALGSCYGLDAEAFEESFKRYALTGK